MAMSGGMRSARVVGRAIGSISLLFQSCCSACRKASGGSCRFRLDRLRTWMSSMPRAAPSSASAPGFSGDPSHTWHNTNTNLTFTSVRSSTELCGTDLGRRCWVHRPTDMSWVYDGLSFIFFIYNWLRGRKLHTLIPDQPAVKVPNQKGKIKWGKLHAMHQFAPCVIFWDISVFPYWNASESLKMCSLLKG